jgi:OOP family OmpA-OmpF porin
MKKTVLASLLAAASMGAFAQGYLGAGFGVSHLNIDCEGTTSCDTSDTGYKVYGGYKFAPMFAVELGYLDFGKAKLAGFGTNYYGYSYLVNGDVKVSAFTLAGVARVPFGAGFSGVARLGVANVNTKAAASVYGTEYYNESETKAKLYYGLGLEFAFNKNIKGVVSADFTQSELSGEKGDVRLIGIGVQYDF